MGRRRVIDGLDLKLLEILEREGRKPYLRLAGDLGITGTAVRKRVEKLVKDGVIRKFATDVDPKKIGFEAPAFLGIDVAPGAILGVASELAKRPGVKRVYTASGEHPLIAEVWARNYEELQKMVEEIKELDGVKNIAVSLVLGRTK